MLLSFKSMHVKKQPIWAIYKLIFIYDHRIGSRAVKCILAWVATVTRELSHPAGSSLQRMVSWMSCSCSSPPLFTAFLAQGLYSSQVQIWKRLLPLSQWPCTIWVPIHLFWEDLLVSQTLSLLKRTGRVSPLLILPVSSYTGGARGCGHSILQNHRKERLISKSNFRHPKCCWLGSKTLTTYSFSVTVSLENMNFICMGHLESSGLRYGFTLNPRVLTQLWHLCRSCHRRGVSVPFGKSPPLGMSISAGWLDGIYVPTLHFIIIHHCNSKIC